MHPVSPNLNLARLLASDADSGANQHLPEHPLRRFKALGRVRLFSAVELRGGSSVSGVSWLV